MHSHGDLLVCTEKQGLAIATRCGICLSLVSRICRWLWMLIEDFNEVLHREEHMGVNDRSNS
jgi:hypothetical protein